MERTVYMLLEDSEVMWPQLISCHKSLETAQARALAQAEQSGQVLAAVWEAYKAGHLALFRNGNYVIELYPLAE